MSENSTGSVQEHESDDVRSYAYMICGRNWAKCMDELRDVMDECRRKSEEGPAEDRTLRFFALLDNEDDHHRRVAALVRETRRRLLIRAGIRP